MFNKDRNDNINSNNSFAMELKKINRQTAIIAIIIIAAIVFISYKMTERSSIKFDKTQMLSTIQKYSFKTITVDDYSIKKVEKTNTSIIYRVHVDKSDYMIEGDFYVALVNPAGGSFAKYVLLNKDLTQLRRDMDNM